MLDSCGGGDCKMTAISMIHPSHEGYGFWMESWDGIHTVS